MRPLILILLATLAATVARAQVEVRLESKQEAYLRGEAIEMAVRISNFTGRPLTFGGLTNWIRFIVDSADGNVVERLREAPESGEFELGSSLRGTLRYDIQPLFLIDTPGRYRAQVIVRVPGQEEAISPVTEFEVIQGTRLWDREFGIPTDAGGAPPERRKYILHQANYLRSVQLYVRVTDAEETHTIKVLPIGTVVSFNRPQYSVDAQSRLHLLHQFGADLYRYHLIEPDGEIARRETIQINDRRPELKVNRDGEIAVIGGERRRTPGDLPPSSQNTDDTTPVPATEPR